MRPGKIRNPSPGSRWGPQTKQVGNAWCSKPTKLASAALASSGVRDVGGTTSGGVDGRARATSTSRSHTSRPSAVATAVRGVSSGGGACRSTAAGVSSSAAMVPQEYPPCPESGGPLNRDGMVSVVVDIGTSWIGTRHSTAVRRGLGQVHGVAVAPRAGVQPEAPAVRSAGARGRRGRARGDRGACWPCAVWADRAPGHAVALSPEECAPMEWFASSWPVLATVVASTVGVYLVVLVSTRIVGLRSFSQMSGFDFAVNIALGSMIAATAVNADVSLADGAVAVAVLFVVQVLIAKIRRYGFGTDWVNNRSLLLMAGPEFVEEHLRRSQLTKDDVRYKLREANVFRYEDVRAVILETTGEVSVLHSRDDEQLDPDLVADVVGAERLVPGSEPPERGAEPPG
ncbi:DUF421 domain-containing protein [Egibacter rhizosphaerae]|uniref:DUF421 domain-containing protein n=2 Tax=Egibacter rhizosphaerae TaxID=1670831 RepID=A0A411YFN1_9ACTN|nr:DUF421 domain-containing protein [Egibacter rhizosphaerae]